MKDQEGYEYEGLFPQSVFVHTLECVADDVIKQVNKDKPKLVPPSLFVHVEEDNQPSLFVCGMDGGNTVDDAEKNLEILGAVFYRQGIQPLSVYYVCEAWAVEGVGAPPSEDADRVRVVAIIASTFTGMETACVIPVKTDGDGRVTLGKPELSEIRNGKRDGFSMISAFYRGYIKYGEGEIDLDGVNYDFAKDDDQDGFNSLITRGGFSAPELGV